MNENSPKRTRTAAALLCSLALLLCTAWIVTDGLFLRLTGKDNAATVNTPPTQSSPTQDYACVKIPPLVGLDERDAVILLQDVGLVAKITECQPTSGKDCGKVIYTRPDANKSLLRGNTVTLFVGANKDAQSVRCPDLVGMCRLDAISTLRAHGLDVGEVDGGGALFSSRVQSQSRVAGTLIPKGSRVDLVLESETVDEFINNRLNFKQKIEKHDNFWRERSFRWHITRQDE